MTQFVTLTCISHVKTDNFAQNTLRRVLSKIISIFWRAISQSASLCRKDAHGAFGRGFSIRLNLLHQKRIVSGLKKKKAEREYEPLTDELLNWSTANWVSQTMSR